MKRWGTIIILLLCLVLVGTTACNPFGGGDKGGSGLQLARVERGDLAVSVTGDGNMETSLEARLSFDTGGRVDKVYVKEGDKVTKGEVLARLDTSALELARNQAQVSLTQAQLALTQAQLAQETAEHDLKNTSDSKAALELALFQAQIDTRTAKYNEDKAEDLYTWSDVKIAQSDADEARRYLEDVLEKLARYDPGTPGYKSWQDILVHAQSRLNTAEDRLEAMIAGRDVEEVAIKKLQVQAAEMAEAQAQKNLDDLAGDIAIKESQLESAKQSTEHARQSVELARQSLVEAQKDLEEATIIAPFDGVVAAVGAKERDIVPPSSVSPRTIVHLIDPSQIELIVELDEIDIPEVKLNQEAIISIDAFPDDQFKGEVTSIYPVPNEVGGVVLYNVKVSIDVPGGSNLKVGMSASADIIIEKKSNVLLVPDRAIGEDSQGKPTVKVMVGEQTEERAVTTGISDGLWTEITGGLSEGEMVVVETKAKTDSQSIGFF